jgi:hypothetical protein
LLGDDPLFHKAVVLLHDIVEVLHGTVPATSRQVARTLKTCNGGRVGWSEIGC